MEFFLEYSQKLKAVYYFHKNRVKRILNTTLEYILSGKRNIGKIKQTVNKIKHVLRIFPCLKYIYKSACVPQQPSCICCKRHVLWQNRFILPNIYCSKFPTSELTGFITITYHNGDFWIKLNEEHG